MSIDNIITIVLAIVPALIGWISSIKVTNNKIEELTKKVDKHNTVIERTYKLEQRVDDIDKQLNK